MVRNQQAVEHVSGQSPAIVPGGRADPWTGVLRVPCSCVGFDVLHNDDDLPVWTFVTVYQMVKPSDGRWRR